MPDRSRLTPAMLDKLHARSARTGHVPWSADELETLRLNFADFPTILVAFVCGHTLSSTRTKANKLGLRKSRAFHASNWSGRMEIGDRRGLPTRFEKGHVPANKGLRRPGWAPGRMAETQFQRGRPANEARNYKPIGSLRISRDGYVERKVTDDPTIFPVRRWVGVHRLVWEAAHGPIPPGHIVRFLPGRRTTDVDAITPDALELVTRAENARRNSYHHRYPEEVVQLIRLKSRLTRKINRKTRHEKQNG